MTLLEALCTANGQQGGTIHQFFEDANSREVSAMQQSFREYTSCGFEIKSRGALNKLAAMYHVTINWR